LTPFATGASISSRRRRVVPPSNKGGTIMHFGLFNTWNALYADGKVPWDPDYVGNQQK
jgi:hypothetical protein